MKRKIDTGHRQTESRGHRAVHEGQADGYAEAAIEHLVQIAVPRIVIVVLVPAKPFFDKKDPVDLTENLAGVGTGRAPASRSIRKVLNSVEIGIDLEVGIGVTADLERDPSEMHVVIAREQSLKLGTIRKWNSHQ